MVPERRWDSGPGATAWAAHRRIVGGDDSLVQCVLAWLFWGRSRHNEKNRPSSLPGQPRAGQVHGPGPG